MPWFEAHYNHTRKAAAEGLVTNRFFKEFGALIAERRNDLLV